MPPRAALPYLLVPLLVYIEKTGLALSVTEELNETVKLLEKISRENQPDYPTADNFAKTLAQQINETIITIYGFGVYRSVAQRFKQQFNENSKIPAKWEYFSELNHNEIVGWENRGKLIKYFSIIFIRDIDEPKEIENRIETTKQIMEKAGLIMYDLQVQGKSTLAKMLSTVLVGDFVSVYLAVLQGIDPTPVKNISYLKDKIKEDGIKDRIIAELDALKR